MGREHPPFGLLALELGQGSSFELGPPGHKGFGLFQQLGERAIRPPAQVHLHDVAPRRSNRNGVFPAGSGVFQDELPVVAQA